MAGKEVRAGKAFVEIALRDRVEAGLKRVSARLRGFAAGVGAIGRPLLALGTGLGAPLAFATGIFAGFDDQMRTVKAVTQATDDQFARLRATAQELGRTTSFTSAQVASLMTELGRAGFNPDQIDAMTASVLDLSRATSTDATLTSGIMAAAIRQFSLEAGDASRVADALTVAANKSFNTLESLGEALTYAGPVASDFNMSIEDTLALLGALGNVGIQGSNAGTALRRLLTISGAEAEKLKRIFGVSFVDMRGNARPLVEVLDEVNRATADLGTAARAQKFNQAFGLLGITGASAISKNVVNVRELRDALADADGVAARTHKEMESGLGGTFRRILSAVEGTAIAIGDALAPALQSLEPLITNVVGAITKWIGDHKGLVTAIAGSIAAIAGIGGVLVGLGAAANLAAVAFSGAAMLWTAATGVLGAIGAAIGLVLSPIGLLVTAVTAAAAAWLYFSGVGGKVARWLQSRFGTLVGFVTKIAGEISQALQDGDPGRAARILWDAIQVAFAWGVDRLSALWKSVQAVALQAWSEVRAAVGKAISGIVGEWTSAQSWLAGVSQSVADAFESMASVIASAFTRLKSVTIETFSAIGRALADGDFAQAAEIAWATIKLAFAQGMAWVTNAWTEFSTGLASIFDAAITSVRRVWNGVSTWIARQLLDLVGVIQSVVTKLAEVDPTGLSEKLKSALDFDVEATIRVLEEDSQRFNQGLDQAKAARDDERVRAMQQQLAETEKQLAELREARRQAMKRAASAGTATSLDGAKLFDASAAQSQLTPPKLPTAAGLGGSAALAGTFNAAIAAMLGRSGDDPAERTADAVESMDGTLTDIRDELRDRPPLAFDT